MCWGMVCRDGLQPTQWSLMGNDCLGETVSVTSVTVFQSLSFVVARVSKRSCREAAGEVDSLFYPLGHPNSQASVRVCPQQMDRTFEAHVLYNCAIAS